MEAFRGNLVHSTWDNPQEVLEDHTLVVEDGKIVSIVDATKADEVLYNNSLSKDEVHVLGEREFLMPGLVDTHIHAPQYVYAGTALDLPLLQWLNKYTFPIESSFSDSEFAKAAYTKAVERTLKNGTTTACWFATIHLEASLILADVIADLGQRAFVGKVNMNQNSPEFYCESTADSLRDTEIFITKLRNLSNPLVTPIITPRFAISCDMNLMKGLADISKAYNVPVQSHISENKSECDCVRELYPQCKNYTDVYDQSGLLTDRAVMAHGIYLNEGELEVFKERGAGIAHCPNSNLSLRSGLCDVRKLLNQGIKVGLGTDVSGGYSPSILNAIRYSTHVSGMLSMQKDANYQVLDYKEAFRLATLGGSQVLGLDKQIGNFEPGKSFDALRINPFVRNAPYDLFSKDDLMDCIQKFFYLGDDRNIVNVYVAGQKVHS